MRSPVIETGSVRRIIASLVYIAALVVLLVPLRVDAVTTSTIHQTFDGITCTGPWQSDPNGLNNSYFINCSNGWVAYALDNVTAGTIGSQNNVSIDTTANGPNPPTAPPPNGAAQLNTAPGNTPTGTLWFYKSFPVQPGVPIQHIQADLRIKEVGPGFRVTYGLAVYDGLQTFKTGTSPLLTKDEYLDGAYGAAGDTCYTHPAGDWCDWRQTVDLAFGKYIVPQSSYITVGFYVLDDRNTQQNFGEIDNLTVSDVVTGVDSPLLPKDQALLWNAAYAAPGTDNMAGGVAKVLYSNGTSYVVGSVYNGSNYDIATRRYDDTGTANWTSGGTRLYDGGSGDRAVAISKAPGGVYVVGSSYILRTPGNLNDPSNNNDFVVIKYTYNGSQQWVTTYNNPLGGRDDVPTSIVTDSTGIYITGSTCANVTACDYLTIKLDTNGVLQWAKTYDGAAGALDKAVGISLAGNYVYVTGRSGGSSDDIVTVKYDATTGAQQWASRYDSGWNERPTGLNVDSAGNSYITGLTYSGGFPSIVALKYDSGGNLLWSTKYSGGSEAIPSALTLDGSGNLYITGKVGRVTDHDMVTLKINGSDGSVAWARTFGNPGFDDGGIDIGVSSAGSVYVLGSLTKNAGNTDIVTVKYDALGNPLSAITYDGGSSLNDIPASMDLSTDSDGDTVVTVTGTSYYTSGLGKWVLLRYIKTAPDLTETAVSGSASGVIGSTITVNDTVKNIDDLAAKKHADTGAFDVGLYLAPGESGTPDLNHLIPLGTRSISNLQPGLVSTGSMTVTIPTTDTGGNPVVEGTYYLVAKADNGGVVSEKDETNNFKASSSTISVTGTRPDLVITSVVLNGSTNIVRPTTISVTTTVTNLTTTPAGAFRVGIYLSPDQTIDPTAAGSNDILIGYRDVSSGLVGPNTATNSSITIDNTVIPDNATGTYYLGAYADSQQAVTEVYENNNSALMSGTSNSTLLVTDKDFYRTGLPGSSQVQVSGKGINGHVMIADKTATWSPKSAWDVPYAGLDSAPALADLTGNKLPDLMVGNADGFVHGYQNMGSVGNPNWVPWSAWDIAPPGSCSGWVGGQVYSIPAIGDMNGDGIPDILMIAYRNGICAYQNTGNTVPPTWQRNSAWDVKSSQTVPTNPDLVNTFNAVALGDLNGDGLLDLVVGQASSTTVYAYKNIGTDIAPNWSYTPAWNIVTGLSSNVPRIVDFNNDGRVDYAMVGGMGGNVLAFKNNATGTLPTPPSWATSSDSTWAMTNFGNTYAAPTFGDIDGDGRVDILLGDGGGTSYGLRNTGLFYANAVAPAYDGVYVSKVVDAGTHGGFSTLSYVTSVPSGTSISVDVRVSNDGSTFTSWYPGIQPGGDLYNLLGSTNRYYQYIQYRVNMRTSNGSVSPALYSIQANTLPAPGTPNTVSILLGSGTSSGSGGGEMSLYELMLLCLAIGVSGRRKWKKSPNI